LRETPTAERIGGDRRTETAKAAVARILLDQRYGLNSRYDTDKMTRLTALFEPVQDAT
jgi:hypothetical protein